MLLQYITIVDTLVAELDIITCQLIPNITENMGIEYDDVSGLLVFKFRHHFLPMNPLAVNILYMTHDDGQYHIDMEYAKQFISYLDFVFQTSGLSDVLLIKKQEDNIALPKLW